jgi:hypothetical protein
MRWKRFRSPLIRVDDPLDLEVDRQLVLLQPAVDVVAFFSLGHDRDS